MYPPQIHHASSQSFPHTTTTPQSTSPKSGQASSINRSNSVLERAQIFEKKSCDGDSSTSSRSRGRERALHVVRKSPPNSSRSATTTETGSQQGPSLASTTEETEGTGDSPPGEAQEQEAVVTPDMLVDALSGHEDGLLAIAEKLMEYYDSGYDVMGEAIIDAFADVQKLFQHVVEAAHMEGAAFEASRRDQESDDQSRDQFHLQEEPEPNNSTPSGLTRHDEFIDQDVRDVLKGAIQKGQVMKDQNKHMECFEIYEEACQSCSSLLPVDSDHRGRLQLSIARAESMSPDRACVILRYAIDDVLRSGQNFLRGSVNPDPSKRGDCVLNKPPKNGCGVESIATGAQSTEEALASLVAEMKEVLSAPVYENSPVKEVAKRFWVALSQAQKNGAKKQDFLEQNLAQLKGEFLLARSEWEEKMAQQTQDTNCFKKKYDTLKSQIGQDYLSQARTVSEQVPTNKFSNITRNTSPEPSPSVASFSSGIAQHARSLVGSFACGIGNPDRENVVKKTSPRRFCSGSTNGSRRAGSSTRANGRVDIGANANNHANYPLNGLEPSRV